MRQNSREMRNCWTLQRCRRCCMVAGSTASNRKRCPAGSSSPPCTGSKLTTRSCRAAGRSCVEEVRMDLQIEGRHTSVTPEWSADIESRVADLRPGHDIKHVRVTLTKHDHRKAEDSFDVLVVMHIPGHTITARKQQDSFEEAIRDTFAAAKTELEKIREKRSTHEVRVTAPPERGIVTKLFQD